MGFLTKTRGRSAIVLGGMTGLLGVLLLFSSVAVMFSPMIFDAPGSTESQALWRVFFSVVGVPVVTVLAIVLSWIAFFLRRYQVALWISLVPVFYVMFVGIALLVVSPS